MTSELISFKDLRPVAPGEMGILDMALADALGFARPRDIRKLIERNLEELKGYGEVCATVAQTGDKGGRPSTEYTLNEHQALVLCVIARTPKAVEVRRAVVEVFMAFRKGRAAASPHMPEMTRQAVRHRRLVRDAKIDFARVVARLDDLGIDVSSIDMTAVLGFSRQFSLTRH